MILNINEMLLLLLPIVIGLAQGFYIVKDAKYDQYLTFSKKAPNSNYPFPFYTKQKWGGRAATHIIPVNETVPYVVIHHSYEPAACFNASECSAAMRSMQRYHQQTQGWADIGYNFAVGSEGGVYEGRGWGVVGAHAIGYNSRSVGIVLIGDWVEKVPPKLQLTVAKKLISFGVANGFISPDYKLIGHRQASSTECPGEALYGEISTWERFHTE